MCCHGIYGHDSTPGGNKKKQNVSLVRWLLTDSLKNKIDSGSESEQYFNLDGCRLGQLVRGTTVWSWIFLTKQCVKNFDLAQIISLIGLIPEPYYHRESLPRFQTCPLQGYYDCTSSAHICIRPLKNATTLQQQGDPRFTVSRRTKKKVIFHSMGFDAIIIYQNSYSLNV